MLRRLTPQLHPRLRKCVRRGRPLGAEDEGELPLRSEVALGRPERGARLAEVERAQHVLLEVAVLAAGGLRLRHGSNQITSRPSAPPLVFRSLQGRRGKPRKLRIFQGGEFRAGTVTRSWSSSPEQPDTSAAASSSAWPRRAGPCARWRGGRSSCTTWTWCAPTS